jgi:hypothetical protein
MQRRGPNINIPQLTRKYRFKVQDAIRAWRRDQADQDIARALNIDPELLEMLRMEIEATAEQESRQSPYQ